VEPENPMESIKGLYSALNV